MFKARIKFEVTANAEKKGDNYSSYSILSITHHSCQIWLLTCTAQKAEPPGECIPFLFLIVTDTDSGIFVPSRADMVHNSLSWPFYVKIKL